MARKKTYKYGITGIWAKIPKSKRPCVVGKMRKGIKLKAALRGCKVKSR